MTAHDFPLDQKWRPVLRDLGVEPRHVLRRARLPEDLFSRSGVRVSTPEYFRFWESLQQEVDDPLFPIRLVEKATAESFVPALFAALCSPNLTTAMKRLSSYKRLVAPIALRVDDGHDRLGVSFVWLDAQVTPPESLGAMELAFIVHLARMATRETIRPLKARAPRPPQPAAAYAQFLGVNVEPGDHVSLEFSTADAELPFLTASEHMWQAFEPELRRRLADLETSATIAQRVQAALLESLPSGQSSAERVAERLAMSKRTLQRRLHREGTTFQDLLETTRRELATHYLSKTELSCSEISFLLGFEDPNSFFRAFHKWTGATPQGVRTRHALPH